MIQILVGLALIPAIVLCVYIYKKDRAEKEPLSLLFLLLGLGAAICFPASLLEMGFSGILNLTFSITADQAENLKAYLSPVLCRVYQSISAVFGVALVEEGLKWLVLFLVTRKNKNFNSLFDGVIYAVFVSLGFAALENVLYSFSFGFSAAVSRMFTAVPGHMFFAVIMGTFYTRWHASKNAHLLEQGLIAGKYLSPQDQTGSFAANARKMLALSLILPVLVHGLYDYCLFIGTILSVSLFYVVLIALYIICFLTIRKMSKQDADDVSVATAMVFAKHPALVERIRQAMAGAGAPASAGAMPGQSAGSQYEAPAGQINAPQYAGAANPYEPAWHATLQGSMMQYAPQQPRTSPAAPTYRRGFPTAAPTAITGNAAHNGNISVPLPNGDHYGGQMVGGRANGFGIYYYQNGKTISGFWKDGVLTGIGN